MTSLLAATLLLVACTDEPRSQRVLEEAGYTDIRLTGYAWGECSDSDTYHTEFTANGPRGAASRVPFAAAPSRVAPFASADLLTQGTP